VTGGTGFLARHILAVAATAGLEIWSLGRRLPEGVPEARHMQFEDPTAARAVHEAVQAANPDVVIHLAGMATGDVAAMYQVNVVFAAHLLTVAAAQRTPPRVFLAGSAAEYGPVAESDLPVTEATPPAPRDAYGITKLAQTLHGLSAAERGLGVVIGRLFNVIGAGMPEHLALGAFAAQIARMGPGGGALVTGDLDVERDFMEAADAARLVVALVTRPDVTGVLNICSGTPTSLRRLVEELVLHCGLPVELRQEPGRRGVTSLRRHFGAALRLRTLGLPVPVFDPVRAAAEVLPMNVSLRRESDR
jgi:GDP-4-dehydro-6-deoxy-D-mannose reductase